MRCTPFSPIRSSTVNTRRRLRVLAAARSASRRPRAATGRRPDPSPPATRCRPPPPSPLMLTSSTAAVGHAPLLCADSSREAGGRLHQCNAAAACAGCDAQWSVVPPVLSAILMVVLLTPSPHDDVRPSLCLVAESSDPRRSLQRAEHSRSEEREQRWRRQ